MSWTEVVQVVGGALVVVLTLYDLFDSVVLPRPSVGRLSPSLALLRGMWAGWRWVGTRSSRSNRREAVLAVYAPLAVLVILAVRMCILVAGFALLYNGLHDEFHPQPQDFGISLYLSTASLLSLGAADVVPTGGAVRTLVAFEAAIGLGLIAVVISFLFSLFTSFQRRETSVVTLDALAGAPPSGVEILEACLRDRMTPQLEKTFDEWRVWSADVLESHLAYPVLIYFRSSHDNEAWINSFGAVMDAAVLVLTTLEECPVGPAHLMVKVGGHLVEDMAYRRNDPGDGLPWVEREDYEEARRRLRAVGYRVREGEEPWLEFIRLRSVYASPLIRLARALAVSPAPWIGDRSYLPHAGRPAR